MILFEYVKMLKRWKQNEDVIKKIFERVSINLGIPRKRLHYDLIKGSDGTIVEWNLYYDNINIMSSNPLSNDGYDIIEGEEPYIYLSTENEKEIYDYVYRKLLNRNE